MASMARSKVGGTARLRSFAAFKLMANAIGVTSSTGKSRGAAGRQDSEQRTVPAVCVLAERGQTAAAPRSVMNWRRLKVST
jgi:hypothetical protein